MSRRKRVPATAYRAEIKRIARRKGADGEAYRYTIIGPHGPVVSGRFNGSEEAAEEHVGRTLKRLNSYNPEVFHINPKKEAARAA